jgi:hypothetical protein
MANLGDRLLMRVIISERDLREFLASSRDLTDVYIIDTPTLRFELSAHDSPAEAAEAVGQATERMLQQLALARSPAHGAA